MPEKLAEQVQEIASGADEHENAAIVKLLDLGVLLYQKLPANMRAKLWQRNQTFSQQQRFRVKVEQRAEKLAESSKMNTFIVFRVPAEKKRLLRSRAEDAKLDVSKFIRSRVFLKNGGRRKIE